MKRSAERILTTHAGSLARPDDLRDMLTARVVGHASDFVEHPELVAERLTKYARAKFEALVEGARQATRQLWK